MDTKKQLALSIINFLKSELEGGGLNEDGREALEVAVQCLENAYGAEGMNFSGTADLLTIYESAINDGRAAAPSAAPSAAQYPQANQVNKEMAELIKVEGNDLMRDGKITEAIERYTKAIEYDPNNAIYYSNRAAAYAKLNDNKNSISDCEKAIKIDPSYSKAYGRMGLAFFNEENYAKAVEAYEKALSLDPVNQPYREQLENAREKMHSKSRPNTAPTSSAPMPPNPLSGMDLGSLLTNPAVMNMAQTFMQNPQVHNMFANMMGGANNPSAPNNSAQPPPPSQSTPVTEPSNVGAGGGAGAGFGGGFDFNTVLNATSQFAQQMQQQNPDVVENLRQQFRQGGNPNNDADKKEDPK